MRPLGLRRDRAGGFAAADFSDPYLQLVHLLTQAAGLEHSLMAAYLYAGWSLRPAYRDVRGSVDGADFGLHRLDADVAADLEDQHTMLDVAIEEMQHLGLVNGLLCDLGAAPVLTPHTFPMSADIYPFAIELRPLTRPVAATFLWVEAESVKFSGTGPGEEPLWFRQLVAEVLGQLPDPIDREPVSHLGSLYHAILRATQRVADDAPAFLDPKIDWQAWVHRMDWILGQGEIAHYRFFRSIFTGAVFDGDADGGVWSDPAAPTYPARQLLRGSGWEHAPDRIVSRDARRLAWLGDLHYWLILGLLDASYRGASLVGRYRAIGQMTRCLWSIGVELADTHEVGFPFDPLGPGYQYGKDPAAARHVLIRMAIEAHAVERELASAGLLPDDYAAGAIAEVLAELESEADSARPAHP